MKFDDNKFVCSFVYTSYILKKARHVAVGIRWSFDFDAYFVGFTLNERRENAYFHPFHEVVCTKEDNQLVL